MARKTDYKNVESNIVAIHSNLDQSIIQITEDKLVIFLKEYVENVECRDKWIAPLGIALTVVVTLVTAEFRAFVVSADTWRAIFIMSGILALAWLVYAVWSMNKAMKIDDVMQKIKNEKQ